MSKVRDFYPLSPMQEGMLFHSLLEPGSGVYVKQITHAIEGELNAQALDRAWKTVVERHAILRTFFLWGDLKKPVQVVEPKVDVALHREDWRALPQAEQEQRLRAYLEADRTRGFDLSKPTLFRLALITLADDSYRLVWTWHHILMDGWSEGLLDKEIFEHYKAYCEGRELSLPRPRPFKEYVHWLQQQDLSKAESFWQRTLKGFTKPVALAQSLSAEEEAQRVPVFERKRVLLSKETTAALQSFTRRQRLTLNTLVQGAWSLILSRYSGQRDVVFGAVVSGRPAELDGVESMLGLFINTLPVRVRIDSQAVLSSWLGEVQARQAEALRYDFSPLSQIQKWSDAPKGAPLFESILAFEMSSLDGAAPARTEQNLRVKVEEGYGALQISNPLSILVQTGPQLFLGISYDGRRFAASLIDRLLDNFQQLLESFIARPEQTVSSFLSEIEPEQVESIHPLDELSELCEQSNLTRNQVIIWLGQKLNADVPLYNVPLIIKMTGTIDRDHLQNAFRTIVNSSDAMRTVFEEKDGVPQQRVLPSVESEMERVDFSQEADAGARLQTWLHERCRTPFQLGKRLFDCALIKVSEREFVAYFNAHQLITDGWSEGFISRQLLALYERSIKGQLEETVKMGQFGDYVEYERNFRRSPQYQEAEAFWQRELAEGAEPLTFYGKPPVKKTPKVEKASFDLGHERTERLKEYAGSTNVFLLSQELTIFSIFVSLTSAFLYRVSGISRIPLGIYFHNRRGFRDAIGLFMHVHPLRINVEESDTFHSLIKKTQSEYLRILKYREYPIANPSRKPVYDVLINFVNTSGPAQINGAKVSYEWLHPGHGAESLNIEFHDFESSGSFEVGFRFHQDVFNERQRAEAIRHFLRLVDSFLEDSAQPISRARLLTEQERQRLLVEFNQTRWDYQREQTALTRFESQAEQTPDKIAIQLQEQSLTYSELNARANQLARHLMKLGVGPETLVGLCAERSPELGVGMLGILKAGAAFVPCDPTYPKDRLEFMLDDSGAGVLLTQQRLTKDLPQRDMKLVCLDSDWQAIAVESRANPLSGVTPDNLAYVIYTSGSTGKPKGTMIEHGSLANYNETATREYGVTAQDRVLQFCSVSFDISIEEIMPCLTNGATLVFRTEEMLESVPVFLHTCREWDITLMSLPTAFWHEMTEGINAFNLQIPAALRLVIIAGEKVLPEKLSVWQKHAGQKTRLINTYGLTESTIISTAIDLTTLTPNGRESHEVPIGRPIRNTQLYVSDENLEPVPVGMPGELHIGGLLLSRGYYRRPGVTAERFVPNPFGDVPGARLYKTGDAARFLPDISLEFLGRSDHQVKIRGFRIELEEVATALRQHPDVRDCAVVLREDVPGQKQLVAYVVPRQQPSSANNGLRGFLAQSLPDYMLPSAFVKLEALPMSPNGKVDYQALPAPDRDHVALEKSYVAPRTPLEKDLAEIWAAVLGLDRVGIHDNYFDLGGDSIRSIQLRAKAQQRGLEFSIQHLFQFQTIQELAQVCSVQESGPIVVAQTEPFSLVTEEDRAKMPPDVEDAYPLARLQAGMLFHNMYHLNSDLYIDVSMIYLQLPYDLEAMHESIRQLIERHPILRTTFDLSAFSEPLQLVWPAAPVRLTVDDISRLSNEEQERFLSDWLEAETKRQFDLTDPPLMRFHVHRRNESAFQFTWSNHHAILDGWSMAVMLTELFQLYNGVLTGKGGEIPPPPAVAYREFVALEREVLNSDEAKRYLTNKVRGLTVTTLPRRPSANSRRRIPEIRSHSLLPPIELCDELKRLSNSVSLPIKSFVLAAQLKVLSMVSGQTDVTTGLVMSGRPEWQDGDRVLGLFTNTLPIRINFTGGTWLDLVRRVFEDERQVIPFRRFPISELKTMEGGQILFETMFNFTHFYLYKTVPRVSGAQVHDVKIRGASNYVFVTDCNQDISSSQFELAFSYDASLIDDEQVMAISHYYLRALEAMVENPYGHYELMSVLSPSEWNQLVLQWNDTAVEYPSEKRVHQLFEAQAAKNPDALAVFYEDEQLTYQDLNRRANQLAHRLRGLGVGPDVLVGVAAERSVELVVALLGILKAGGAYVPLDPSYPKHRLEFMLADSGVSVLLTQSHLLSRLPETKSKLLCLDSEWATIALEPDENPQPVTEAGSLVYMIYTSGSTGQPKGALNTHRGLHNRLAWMQQQYNLTPADRVLQKTTFSFDVSVWEFFWPLMTGAQLVLARPGGHQDSAYLVQLINSAQITTLHFVPSVLQAFLDEPEVESCRSLRQVISSGEALSYELQERFFERLKARLHNLYGPTEASIDVTFWECGTDEKKSVPIGRPIANTEIYLLDPTLQPVPVGAPGELYIGGIGLARGYHQQPEMTAQKFTPHPFSHRPADRLYKTGDLARYRPDGNIEYLGRSDHQVKIRGFRIEPGEIEAALREFDNVKDLLVQASDDASGEKRLVAYVVYDHEPPPTNSDIRKFLGQKLPDYMVPSAFVMMSSFPLTPNGKVNRRALLAIRPGKPESERTFVAARNPLERRLVAIWEQVFNTQPIGVEDNFFDLGGHSILAVRLMAQVHKEFGQELPLSTLTEGGTIAHVASVLSREHVARSAPTIVPIQPEGSKPPFFCVHPLGGHVLRFYDLARKLGQDQPFYGIQGRDLADVQKDYVSIEQTAEIYVKALRETQPDGPYYIGGFSFGSFVAFEMAQQLVRSGQEVALLVLLDTWSPLVLRLLPEFDNDAVLLTVMAKETALRAGRKDFELSMSDLEELEGDEQLRYVFEKVKEGGLVTEDIPEDIVLPYVRRLMSGIRTRGAAFRSYEPSVYPGKITSVRCLEQDPMLVNTLAQAGANIDDPTSGWSPLSAQPVEVHFVKGYHERMMNDPTVGEVAKVLKECMERALAPDSNGNGSHITRRGKLKLMGKAGIQKVRERIPWLKK